MRLLRRDRRDHDLERELHGRGPWFNVPDDRGPRLGDLTGTVVLLQFWTYVCGNCTRTVPLLQELHDRHPRTDLQVIGIHTPELAVDRRPRNVASAIATLGISYPVVMDNDFDLWSAWDVRAWPTAVLIDRSGHVRRRYVGEDRMQQLARAVATLVDDG